jgi:drug/metabolite transporter (DMT)-like permease
VDSNLLGESAAILTSCMWTGSSIFFTLAGRRFGSFSVNAYRTLMAIGLLVCAHLILLNTALPIANGAQWFWMGLSGIIGLGIGDLGLFAAYVTIGPRLSVLVQSTAAIFASIGAYVMLDDKLSPISIIGVSVTITGIMVALSKKEGRLEENYSANNKKTLGVFFALVSAMGQGFGVVLSKKGMYARVDVAMNPLSAALIRLLLTGIFVWGIALFAGKLPELHKALRDREGMKHTAAGAFIGPFIGMTLSMVAVANAQPGVAQTLMSLMPIFIIPVMWIVYREKTSMQGILGTFVAVLGVAILFLT